MSWKLVFVAAMALVVTIAAPIWSIPAPARASVHAPTMAIAPAVRARQRAQVRTSDAVQPIYVAVQKASQQPQPPASSAVRQATIPDDGSQERRLSPGAILGLICSIAASSVALGIAFGLRRRIDRIAGPDPDKNDED